MAPMDCPSRSPRVPFEGTIWVRHHRSLRRARTGNLSLGGLFVEDGRPPEAGERVTLELETEEQTLPLGEAEVVWGHPSGRGFGVRFLGLPPEARSLVEALLRHRGAQFWEDPTRPDRIAQVCVA